MYVISNLFYGTLLIFRRYVEFCSFRQQPEFLSFNADFYIVLDCIKI